VAQAAILTRCRRGHHRHLHPGHRRGDILIWHRSATTRAKVQLVREREYRELAEGAIAAQDRNDSFEKTLKEVE
jgi:hypothetical protein